MTPQDAMRHALEWIEAQPEPRMIGAAKIIEALRSALAQQDELGNASKSEQLLASQDHALRAEFQRMKAALAQQGEQQPVAWIRPSGRAMLEASGYCTVYASEGMSNHSEPLFAGAAPAAQPLTDEQIKEMWIVHRAALPRYLCFAKAIERHHGIGVQK